MDPCVKSKLVPEVGHAGSDLRRAGSVPQHVLKLDGVSFKPSSVQVGQIVADYVQGRVIRGQSESAVAKDMSQSPFFDD